MGKFRKIGKAVSEVILITGGVFGCLYGITRFVNEMLDYTNYDSDSARMREAVGVEEVRINAEKDGMIEMDIRRGFTLKSHVVMSRKGKEGELIKLKIDDFECTRNICDESVYRKAEELWKEYWEAAEGDKFLETWKPGSKANSKDLIDKLD